MTDAPSVSDDGPNRPTFAAPWQARAFALAVAVTDEETDRPWDAFQRELVAEIDRADASVEDIAADGTVPSPGADDDYYRQWLAALERFLTGNDLIDPDTLADRAAAFADGDRDAHEFVHGDPRAHTDHLLDGHAEGGHGHDHDGDHGHHGSSLDTGDGHHDSSDDTGHGHHDSSHDTERTHTDHDSSDDTEHDGPDSETGVDGDR
ncbi:MAG: nitrile hydratase accessory protein [Halobaculum sp.]